MYTYYSYSLQGPGALGPRAILRVMEVTGLAETRLAQNSFVSIMYIYIYIYIYIRISLSLYIYIYIYIYTYIYIYIYKYIEREREHSLIYLNIACRALEPSAPEPSSARTTSLLNFWLSPPSLRPPSAAPESLPLFMSVAYAYTTRKFDPGNSNPSRPRKFDPEESLLWPSSAARVLGGNSRPLPPRARGSFWTYVQHTYKCIYIYIYVCMCIYIYIYIDKCNIHIIVCIYIFIYIA